MQAFDFWNLLEDAWHHGEPCILTANQAKELADHIKRLLIRDVPLAGKIMCPECSQEFVNE